MVILKITIILSLFLLWTLLVYLMHRLAHVRHTFNFLYKIHIYHHKIDYFKKENRRFKWYYMLFYFGGVYETLDVLFILTMPLLFIYILLPNLTIYLVIFHYLYEVFLSEGMLDHNPNVNGKITTVFSWGSYHLIHHKTWKYNYSLMITIWDRVFKTTKEIN